MSTFINNNTIIICIGSARVTGDALGPLVGTLLEQSNFALPVYGTMDNPIHSMNLEKKIVEIKRKHRNCRILAIDASITKSKENVGDIKCNVGYVSPGRGVNKKFSRKARKIGQVYICGITEYCESNLTPRQIVAKLIEIDYGFVENLANVISTLIQRGYENNQTKKISFKNKLMLKISMIGR